MSQAKETFRLAIRDATSLLDRFDQAKQSEPAEAVEVLKRAGLIMAATAWETYVEDRLREGVAAALGASDSPERQIVERLLERDLGALHNPSSEKVRELFSLFLGVDVTAHWTWPPYEPDRARRRLNEYLRLRGDAVHRARVRGTPTIQPHLVSREELRKVITFIEQTVEATERALSAAAVSAPTVTPAASTP